MRPLRRTFEKTVAEWDEKNDEALRINGYQTPIRQGKTA
jgi:hypothetical protein